MQFGAVLGRDGHRDQHVVLPVVHNRGELRPTRPQLIGKAPFLGASPDSVNFTIYYETDRLSARVSTAYRAEYFTTYPLQTGTCAPGFCTTPLINKPGRTMTTPLSSAITTRPPLGGR